MDDASERERRRAEITTEVRERQEALGHDSPLPAFLNLVTDRLVDIEMKLDRLLEDEDRLG